MAFPVFSDNSLKLINFQYLEMILWQNKEQGGGMYKKERESWSENTEHQKSGRYWLNSFQIFQPQYKTFLAQEVWKPQNVFIPK